MNVQVREATIKDIRAISDLGRTTYKDHFSDIWHDIDAFLDNDFTDDAIRSCITSPSESAIIWRCTKTDWPVSD